ncbi:Maf-like protein [Naasia aerilata]|uniref:Nucleoside triphosphate pyrophosphatase n=1 Tax=Naasia aerilata TaxID=1162966 RepID=A0ABN6XLV2_9MICO|nr:Maf-like protein [Naasia aerilata]
MIPSAVDEPAAVAAAESERGSALSAPEMVLLLARAKAEDVATTASDLDGLVLGGDSAFELDGIIYGKPHEPHVARARWLLQRGRTGLLHSGSWLIDARRGGTGRAVGEVATATVSFAADIRDDEIDAYIATGEPLAVAGAFTIDSLGGPFVERIEGDPSTVVGLSLPTLRQLLHRLDVALPSLWNR